jgi:hypothetical protein
VLAEAHLERALLPDLRLGLSVGLPARGSLTPEMEREVEGGLAALERAAAMGEEGAEWHRLRSALHARRITGFASMLRERAAVQEGLDRAAELGPELPRVQIAIGCRLLFAPPGFGHDPRAALAHLMAGAEAIEADERPLVFAAFARHLLGEPDEARALLRRALGRTPANVYAAEVLRRLEAGEDEPFRDLDG